MRQALRDQQYANHQPSNAVRHGLYIAICRGTPTMLPESIEVASAEPSPSPAMTIMAGKSPSWPRG